MALTTFKSAYDYTQTEKSSIIWAVAIGTIIGTFPINYFYIKYGARYPFLIAGITSTLSTFLIPAAARLGLSALLVTFKSAYDYTQTEKSSIIWAVAIGTIIGTFPINYFYIKYGARYPFLIAGITSTLSTFLIPAAARLGLTALLVGLAYSADFAAIGLVCVRWAPLSETAIYIAFLTSFTPISAIITNAVTGLKDKSAEHIEHKKDVPYKMSAMILLSTYSPTYFRNVFGFKVETTGLLVSLTTVAQLPCKLAAGLASDRIKFLSEKVKMNIFNTLAVGVVGAMFCFVGQHAHVVIATIQFMKCVALFTAPALVNAVVDDDSNKMQWAVVFVCCGVVMIIANLLSFPVFTDQPAPWTTSKPKAIEDKKS
ncbi:transporter, major facilitator family protein [Ancylostoma duodenale]|uniref:Transporter, major facilitator family protein n=1 Tax=Ancylostoma duodenale TaxID=51022 RepID=A0A0C2CE82_9BILA|nr:transporter, major facilitator family protein [Ancylostoma duodenale]